MRNLPSWVPDFTRLELTNPLIRMRMGDGLPYHANGDSSPRVRVSKDGNLLFSWGKIVDTIKDTAPPLDEVYCIDMEGLSPAEIWVQRLKKWLAFRKEIVGYETSTKNSVTIFSNPSGGCWYSTSQPARINHLQSTQKTSRFTYITSFDPVSLFQRHRSLYGPIYSKLSLLSTLVRRAGVCSRRRIRGLVKE